MSKRFCIASYFFRDAVTKTALDAKRLIIRVLGAAGLAWLALASMTGQAAASAGCDRFTGATDVGWINYGVSTYSSGKLSAFAAGDRLKIRASATPAPSFFVKKSWDQLSFLTSADGVIELAITAQMINAYPDGVLNISANANDVSLLLSCSGVPSPTAPPPGLSSISVAPYDKAASTLAGGGAATITGSNLSDVTRVKFGAATATITSKADTSISVTVPASAAAGVSSSGGDVTVVASNNGGDSSALAFTYAPPVVVSNPNAAYSAPADATVSVDFSAAVFSGGYGRLTYSATGLPAGFSIDSGSGVVSGRATYVPKTTIRVTATDQIGQSNASSIDFQTNPPRLQASARSIPPLYVGVAASEAGGVGFYPVEMTGGYSVPPGYVFSEPQGRLANLGLTLAADGKVTGAPAATFNGAITLAINDQANQSVTQDFTLVVHKAPQTVSITSTAPTPAVISGTYQVVATSVRTNGGASTGLRPRISVSGDACTIDANNLVTFTAAGTCTVSASITNDATFADASASAPVISVGKKPQIIVLTSTPPASARVNDAYQIAGYLMRGDTRVDNADVTTATNTDVCTVNNALVTMKAMGTCTITVSKAGDATYDAAPPLTQTIPVVGKAAHMLASDAISAPSGAAAGGSYKPILKTSSAGLTPVLTSSAASICRVDADGTVRFLSAGKCTLMATAGNGDYADVSARLDITVAPANQPVATTVTLQASPTRPLVGQKMLVTASVTPLAATGTVTFRDGAAVIGSVMVSGGKASVTTGAMSAGAHAITAAYSGDAIYAPATSVTAAITPTAPPNPTSDKSVRGIVATQSATAQRVVSRQLDTVQRRLEFLHDDNGASFVNGLSISAPSGLPPGASPFDDPVLRGQGFSRSEAGQALDRTLDRSFGKFATSGQDWDAPAKAKPDGDRFSPLEASGFKVWTSGSVIFGGVTVSALGVETKTHFTLSGITAGVDTRLMEGLKGGFAVSYSGQSDDLGADGSRMDSRTLTGSLYASWRVADKVFLDGSIGYGDLFFSSKRLDGNGAGFIRGERRGKLLFGSLALSYDETLGPLKLSPYARLDGSNASLNAYAETGADDWTLSYDKATLASQSLALGLRGQYDIEQPWGTLSPTWRAEYGRLLSGDLTQMVSYATDASTRYAMTTAASDRDSLSAALGLKARSKRDVTGALEYLLSGGLRTGVQGQGLRGMLRVGF